MDVHNTHTYQEIMSQPSVWADVLAHFFKEKQEIIDFWNAGTVDYIVFTGCGSTFYLAKVAAELFQSLVGIPCQARPASEIVLFSDLVLLKNKRPMLVAISRSGETTETVDAVRLFRKRTNGRIFGITCDSHSSLVEYLDLVLALDMAQEISVAQTRSFSSMTLVLQALAGQLSGCDSAKELNGMPEALDQIIANYHELVRTLGESPDIDRFFFLGSGYLHGIAKEAMLKMKEMSLAYSEAYHSLEFRHGPMSVVNDRSLITGLISSNAVDYELPVLSQMKKLGGQILVITASGLPRSLEANGYINLNVDRFAGWVRPILYLPILQLLAYYRAMYNGQNPDRPANLKAVIELESFLAQ